jgi:hypothetical protein
MLGPCGRMEGGGLALPFADSLMRLEARQPSPIAVACKTSQRPRLSQGGALVFATLRP